MTTDHDLPKQREIFYNLLLGGEGPDNFFHSFYTFFLFQRLVVGLLPDSALRPPTEGCGPQVSLMWKSPRHSQKNQVDVHYVQYFGFKPVHFNDDVKILQE
jgi:hypothetical protein